MFDGAVDNIDDQLIRIQFNPEPEHRIKSEHFNHDLCDATLQKHSGKSTSYFKLFIVAFINKFSSIEIVTDKNRK